MAVLINALFGACVPLLCEVCRFQVNIVLHLPITSSIGTNNVCSEYLPYNSVHTTYQRYEHKDKQSIACDKDWPIDDQDETVHFSKQDFLLQQPLPHSLTLHRSIQFTVYQRVIMHNVTSVAISWLSNLHLIN